MRKSYKLKSPQKRDGKVVRKAGEPVPLTRAQFEALHAQGLVDAPVDPAEAWAAPKARKKTAATGA